MSRSIFFAVLLAILPVALGLLAAAPVAAVNDRAVLVLHAIPASSSPSCRSLEVERFDCRAPATVSVGRGEPLAVFLLVYDLDDLSGVQCRFDWPADWTFQGWRGGCQANQLDGVVPTSNGARDLATVFDAVTAPARIAPIGWLAVLTGGGGCLEIGESGYPFGTHIIGSGGTPSAVPADRRGSICAGRNGVDGCALARALTGSTWGAIKAGFEQ